MDEIEEAMEKYKGLVPLVYDIERQELDEAKPNEYKYAVYLKLEADIVIRHHKYKRCLEKAKTLDRDATISNFMIVTEKEDGQKENHKKKAAFYRKWSNKWLDLAEHYKEGI
jgi:hypothetical protein